MPEITVESADGSRQRFRLAKPRITIGRSRDSDIFLPDQWLSRQHAEILEKSGAFVLLDLGSKNGTLVNGEKVSDERRLRDGDVISLGEHQLTFTSSAAAAAAVVEDEPEPEGTVIFSARDLSEIRTKPAADAEELRRQNRLLELLTGATQSLLDHRPLDELFDHVLNLLLQAVPAERVAILMLEGTPPEAVVKATRSRRGKPITHVSRSIARRALKGVESLLIHNILEDADLRAQDSILSTGIRTAMCAPLWFRATDQTKDAVIGLVYLDSLLGSTQSFSEEDLKVVTALAHVAAAKIENVRLLEESMEKRSMEEDMRRAAEIQRGLLPDCPPEVAGYDLCGVNFPCRAVGGDYFDYVCEGGDLLFALGDVSGKGTGAALLMTVLRASVRAHWAELAPAEAMARINRTVYQNVPSNKYITFFLGRLEPNEGRVTYVNAGHNPPLLVHADGRLEMLEDGGVVLGLFEATPYGQGETTLGPGDTLVVFSDGVTETFSSRDEEFGEQRLGEIVRRGRSLDAAALQAEILRELEAFSGGQKATDDRTLIILKRV
jgi:sigma-B regulation protein RsbU (phosphoserine phosphatase)